MVFQDRGDRGDRAQRRFVAAFGIAFVLYGGAIAVVLSARAGAVPASTGPAARSAEPPPIEVEPPPPQAQPAPLPGAPTVAARSPAPPPRLRAAGRATRPARPVAPAEAAAVLTRSTDAPIDLTAETFVTGNARAFPGGETAGLGRSKSPVTGAVDLRAPAAGSGPAATGTGLGPERRRAVTLADGRWTCPWPMEADAQQIDTETVVLRVRVRPSGRVEAVELVSDPGAGFGPAAAACARQTRFDPARDGTGAAVDAWSPPIRVHFAR
jgi:protein TonB